MAKEEFFKQPTASGIRQDLKGVQPIVPIPKKIGPYLIESLLEMGGMSILYLGVHPDTKGPTAIKVLSQRFVSNQEVIQRFLNEAEIIGMTDHPNIVKLYGHGEWEGGLYIAMEFIQGLSLRQQILRVPISLKRALEIIIDIAYALCHLHTHGVIHRDLKPENILITNDSQIKVIDFGIAQLLSEQILKEAPFKQRMIGTPVYISPEQRDNPESVSYPSDIYSLGIISYELILGRLSQGHIHLSLMPKGLQKILNKALQPLAKDRYQDIVDFITDISMYYNSTNMKKEKPVGDLFREYLESIHTPPSIPKWQGFDIGLSSYLGTNIYGVYYEFLTFPDGSYGIMTIESSIVGAEGMTNVNLLRGMIQALRQQTTSPSQLAKMLNVLICNTSPIRFFGFSYLKISPQSSTVACIACGNQTIWKIVPNENPIRLEAQNPYLGAHADTVFVEQASQWKSGETIVMNLLAFGTNLPINNASYLFFEKIFQENGHMSINHLASSALQKTILAFHDSYQEHSIVFLCIKNCPLPK